jgi:acyl-CoA thioester hydrolase
MHARDPTGDPLRAPGEVPVRAFRLTHAVTSEQLSALVPHANNVQIVGWIDEAARAHGDASGLTRERMHREGRMWFVARHEIDYLAESFAGDQILVATWLTGVTRTTAMRATRVWRRCDSAPDGWTLAVDALSRWVHMNLSTRRPSRIPPADLDAYGWGEGSAPQSAAAPDP